MQDPVDPIQDGPATEHPEPQDQDAQGSSPGRWRAYGCLLLALVLVLGSLLLGFQLITILYAILFPPNPPLPDGVNEISHNNLGYGVDQWIYGTDATGCEILAFFRSQGAACSVSEGICLPDVPALENPIYHDIGTCTGEMPFSIFRMTWEVTISTGYLSGDITRFNIDREVQWLDSGGLSTGFPESTPEP